jgi:hypothetical protein
MKTPSLVFAAAAALAGPLSAQPFSISPSVIATGGGTATGGPFQLTGTIGQSEAGPRLSGGCLSVDPGFWGRYSLVATPGAPILHARQIEPNYVRVAFVPGCGAWVLQWTRVLETDPTATVWTDDDTGNLVLVGDELTRNFHVPSWGPRLFFRLRSP